jgi:hypothetical protein
MISFLGEELPEDCSIRIYTTHSNKNLSLFITNNKRVKIKRLGNYSSRLSVFKRLQLYFTWNLGSFFDALFWRPGKVLYYETFSTFPAWLLKKVRPSLELFIHYHEYMTREEYSNVGLLKRLHVLEKKIYNQARWISHTNDDRLQLFVRDAGIINDNRLHSLPNFPSRRWNVTTAQRSFLLPIRIIYIGAIGFEDLYIKEFAWWVESQNGKVTWDIYTQQDDGELKAFLNQIKSKFISAKGFISYQNMPDVLNRYDVGVILYKGRALNFVYNAPNKLFEYLACDLDVWFPEELKGALPYINKDSYPKVLSLSFKNPDWDLEKLADRKHVPYRPTQYFCEEQYRSIKGLLLQ